jgi:regulator of sigma E protease
MQYLLIVALVLGFGFVVFFHELGHFLAAKWVGIRVEQFAVGFGHAILAWRKGLGVRVGTTTPEYDRRIKEYIAEHEKELAGAENDTHRRIAAAKALGLGETEYRWNWIPLGGYVKMLGQDDMNPNALSEDPRAYNRKSIGARMVVVSAGVIMNVILALLFFAGLFLYGYHVPPAVVGGIQSNSPAQLATLESIDGRTEKALLDKEGNGLRPGDQIEEFNGSDQYSFMKLQLDVALVRAGQPIPVKVNRGGHHLTFSLIPQKPDTTSKSFYAIGITPPFELKGPEVNTADEIKKLKLELDPAHELMPGEVVTAINGQAVTVDASPKTDPQAEAKFDQALAIFDRALQNSQGKSVDLSVRGPQGQRTVTVQPRFQAFFGREHPFNIAGLQPAPMVSGFIDALMKDKLKIGDVITGISVGGENLTGLTEKQFIDRVLEAGKAGRKIGLIVDRDGKRLAIDPVVPSVKIDNTAAGGSGKGLGLGIGLEMSSGRPIVAAVQEKSSMAAIPPGALITSINGTPTQSWHDVRQALVKAGATASVSFTEFDANGKPRENPKTVQVALSSEEQADLAHIEYASSLSLTPEHNIIRKTHNPLLAAQWGAAETRDLLLQFYVTLVRLTQGSVSATNFMGPLGIVRAGSIFASKGPDWLIWFLAMISANLAVVNFLPIPIVDGGLFMFLILEKIQGKPLSPRMQVIAQYVGLAIIVSVFLMVTYQDIVRW